MLLLNKFSKQTIWLSSWKSFRS